MSGEGFLSRWSKRKAEHEATAPSTRAEPTEPAAGAEPAGLAEPAASTVKANPSTGGSLAAKMPETARQSHTLPDALPDTKQPKPPLPTIESLTNESDFTPFMATDVPPDMRNQAMKKLFTDPHYNLMDGLDTYIDDYGKPDPLPEGWLQMMNQSKTLRLFETKEEEAARLGAETLVPATPDQAARPADHQQLPAPDDVRPTPGTDADVTPTEIEPAPRPPPAESRE